MPVADRSVDVLLIGGGVTSMRCARTLRRIGFDGSILLVGTEDRIPYNRPPLSKELLRHDLPDELVAAASSRWYQRRGVELRTAVTVTSLDAGARAATLSDGTTIRFERCLLGTGAAPRALAVPGGERALLLRTLADARLLRAAATEAPPGAGVVVVGGGFIGIEVASGLAAIGLKPTIVELADQLWAGALGTALADWAGARLDEAGVEVRLGAGVTRVGDGEAWLADERLVATFTVAGIGVRPRVELAAGAGLDVDDGIVTDRGQRTSDPAIWAAGDVARADGRRIEHWHAAREAGERAALSMLGAPVPPAAVPWLFSEVAGTPVDVIGIAEAWDEERWLPGGSILAYAHQGRLVQMAIIDSALSAEHARELVGHAGPIDDLEGLLASVPAKQ